MTRFALVVALGGCFRSHVPDQMQGSIPLVVANLTQDNACKLVVTQAPTPARQGDNWLGMGGLSRASTSDFKIKSGTYNIWIHACGDLWDGQAENVAIDGPTWVGVGAGARATPPAGYKTVFLSMQQSFVGAPTCNGHPCP